MFILYTDLLTVKNAGSDLQPPLFPQFFFKFKHRKYWCCACLWKRYFYFACLGVERIPEEAVRADEPLAVAPLLYIYDNFTILI